MLKILLITIGLLIIAFAGMAVKMLFDRNAEFSGGSCRTNSSELENKGISCGCGGHCAPDNVHQ
jgi:hypothetical protein